MFETLTEKEIRGAAPTVALTTIQSNSSHHTNALIIHVLPVVLSGHMNLYIFEPGNYEHEVML